MGYEGIELGIVYHHGKPESFRAFVGLYIETALRNDAWEDAYSRAQELANHILCSRHISELFWKSFYNKRRGYGYNVRSLTVSKKNTSPLAKISPEFSRTVETILRSDKALSINEQDLKDYIRLIMAIAKPYVRTFVEYEDLVMEGVAGLLKARKNFDPTRSSKFKTFASICILGEIYSYCQANHSLVSVPTHISKASNYIGKMYKLVRAFSVGNPSEDAVNDIVLLENTELAKEHLAPQVLDKLQYNKDRIRSIAKNSNLTYEELAALAKKSIVSTVSDTVIPAASYTAPDRSAEKQAGERELQKLLLESLGRKRFMVLELHYKGYSNPEIAEILHEQGYSNSQGKPISRSAVKSLIDNAITAIRKTALFSEGVGKNKQ